MIVPNPKCCTDPESLCPKCKATVNAYDAENLLLPPSSIAQEKPPVMWHASITSVGGDALRLPPALTDPPVREKRQGGDNAYDQKESTIVQRFGVGC